MFSMLNAIGEISKVADFTTPCVNITNSAFSQLPNTEKNAFFYALGYPSSTLTHW